MFKWIACVVLLVQMSLMATTPTAVTQSVVVDFDTATDITLTGTPSVGITFQIAVNPSHGNLSGVAPDVTYTPDASYSGLDSFYFTVTLNSVTVSALAAVSISVTVDPGSNNTLTDTVYTLNANTTTHRSDKPLVNGSLRNSSGSTVFINTTGGVVVTDNTQAQSIFGIPAGKTFKLPNRVVVFTYKTASGTAILDWIPKR